MSNIWLIDFDSKIPNLALMKLSTWHKNQGDNVILKHKKAYPEMIDMPDMVYISCVFSWNKKSALYLAQNWQAYVQTHIGGSGIDYTTCLPPIYENLQPDYDLYPNTKYALGFISRGCIRNCPWCIVPRKEGKLKRVSTAQEVVGDKKEVIFLDNNFLALDDFESDLEWLVKRKTRIDFNQGLDARLVDNNTSLLLAKCKWSNYIRFALDTISQKYSVEKAINLLRTNGLKSRIAIYVLIGKNGFESDVERLLFCHQHNVIPRPMRYIDRKGTKHATGWPIDMWRKFPRLVWRYYHQDSVWDSFRSELQKIST